jgi:hypothetical protein
MYNQQEQEEQEEDSEVEEQEEQEAWDKYAIQLKKTNKDELYQPRCVKIGLIPTLPTGIISIGRSGSGKTQCIVNLLTNKNLLGSVFDFIYLFTGVKPDQELIKDLKLPKENIKTDFTEETVQNIMDKMEKTVEKQGMKNTPSVFFLFDDILGNKDFLKSKTLTKLTTTNRHCNISYAILSQYYKKLPPVVRTNASYLIIFPSSMIELEKVAQEQCPPQLTIKDFIKIAKHATKEKFQFLSIHNKTEPHLQLRKNFNTVLTSNTS